MSDKIEQEKLKVLLNHWVEHNRGHAQEFGEWAEKSRELGLAKASGELMLAAQRLEEANERLLAALEHIQEA